MRSIPEAVRHVIEKDSFLHFGLANRVLNLSKTARFILPLVAARTKKAVSPSAVTMALSRLRVSKHKENTRLKTVRLNELSITKNLTAITYERTSEVMRLHHNAVATLRQGGIFVVSNIGTSEITTMIDADHESILTSSVKQKPKALFGDLVAIHAQFNLRYVEQTGMLYTLMQQLAFQNINVIELSSTYTEIIFFIEKKDMKIAFDTLYEQFM
jgi:aspartokinase